MISKNTEIHLIWNSPIKLYHLSILHWIEVLENKEKVTFRDSYDIPLFLQEYLKHFARS